MTTLVFNLEMRISFRTTYIVIYADEREVEHMYEITGNSYSREFYYSKKNDKVNFMVFVNNKEHLSNEFISIDLFHKNKTIKNKTYHINNFEQYDGWFIFEFDISNYRKNLRHN